jgi:Fic family protein
MVGGSSPPLGAPTTFSFLIVGGKFKLVSNHNYCMVFIHKKKVGDKEYYYLQASIRKGLKVIKKDIAYLGNDPNKIKEKIDKLPSQYSKDIRKSYKTIEKFLESNHFLNKVKEMKLKKNIYLNKNLLEEIEACKMHWNNVFFKLDETTKKESFQDFLVEFAYNSSGIEGNTISLKEAQNLLIEDLAPKNKTLREIHDLKNTQKVFFELLEKPNEKITHDLICEIHDKLLKEIDSRKGYRTQNVRLTKTKFKSTPAPYVLTDMKILLEWFNKNENKLHPIVLGTILHHKFEKIHPFMDGNGRTGRMLINYIVMQKNYPPVILKKKNRLNYIEKLNKADKSNPTENKPEHYTQLIEFTAKELKETYWNTFL